MHLYQLSDFCEDCLTLPDHDNAIIGVVSQSMGRHVLYSVPKIIDNLVNEGLTVEDALEHFDYNMKGSSQGDDYPMFLDIELNPVIDNGEYSYEIVE
jgi:hypothetical protein